MFKKILASCLFVDVLEYSRTKSLFFRFFVASMKAILVVGVVSAFVLGLLLRGMF